MSFGKGLDLSPCHFTDIYRVPPPFQRWLKQALEEEGSTSPVRRPSLLMPCEGPLSPSINGDSDSPLPYNGTCSLPGSIAVEQVHAG